MSIARLESAIANIEKIQERGDVIAIQKAVIPMFECNPSWYSWYQFIYIWALREPCLNAEDGHQKKTEHAVLAHHPVLHIEKETLVNRC